MSILYTLCLDNSVIGPCFTNSSHSYEKSLEAVKDQVAHAQERLYPSIPSPSLPTTLPLADYVGTYTHPVYPSLTITLSSDPEPVLLAENTGLIPTKIKLTHVSRDYFTAELRIFHYAHDPSAVCRVQFQVDVKGVPKFGAELEFDTGDTGDMIWFEREHARASKHGADSADSA